jgi:general secretion pathway protein D
VDANRRQVYVRDHVTRVRLAEALYRDLTRRRGEVLLELELVSVNSSKVTNLGATLPTSFPAFYFGTFGNSQPPANTGPLVGIGGGDTLFGIRIGDAAFQANWNRSQGRLLSRFEVRPTDGLPASLHIGDRYPIVNAIFSPIVVTDQIQNLQNSGQYRQPFPSFTFEDLGLVLKVTPRVHDRREVSLTIEAEFRVLAGTSLNGLPVISSRKFSSAVRLREGESSLVSGLAVLQNVHTRSGLGPLAEIPLLGHLLGSHQWQADQSELLVSITPHLTVAPPGEQDPPRSFHYGAELRPVPSL